MSARMPRELAEVADEIRAVPAPPVPVLPQPYEFRVADPDADAEQISVWMNRPHLVQTWRYDRPPSQWRRHLAIQLAGTFSRPLVASYGGRDFAYVEIFRAAKDVVSTLYDAEPYDVGIHAAIAEETEVNQGRASHLGPYIADSVFNLELRCRRLVFDFEPFNVAARKFLQRFGCVFLGEYNFPNRCVALCVLPRSANDIPQLHNQASP